MHSRRLAAALFLLAALWGYGEAGAAADKPTKILVHYMPWYQTPDVAGYWGWHWTMNHFNPARVDDQGHREIASHHYPKTGPYDSQDGDVLEYQVLLMKLAGIDGVVVDWYGIVDHYDWGIINTATHALFNWIEKAGLYFSICYEDQTVKEMVSLGILAEQEAHDHGKEVMSYLDTTWFDEESYVRISDRPVLFNFGAAYFSTGSDWETLFSELGEPPVFFTLNYALAPAASGAYPWPPMYLSQDGVLSQDALNGYLRSFYQGSFWWDHLAAGAFPGFHDIYREAGLGFSYGYLDPEDGKTFRSTLDSALSHQPDLIQIATWNDYGEGTVVEPTVEFGYRYLEMVQEARRDSIDPAFPFTAEDLRYPFQVYRLRKELESDSAANAVLDAVFERIIEGDLDSARSRIDSLTALCAPGVVTGFTAAPGDSSITLSWINPPDGDFLFTNIRYSTDSFPAYPDSGLAVENGMGGVFAGGAGSPATFVHRGLNNGTEYFYSAFAADADSFFAPAASVRAVPTQNDLEPPTLSIGILQNPYLTDHLDVYVVSTESLDSGSVAIVAGADSLSPSLVDPIENVWRCDYTLSGQEVVSIVTSGEDIAGNEASAEIEFSAKWITAGEGGALSSPCGALELRIPGGALAMDAYILVVPYEGMGTDPEKRLDSPVVAGTSSFILSPPGILGRSSAEIVFRRETDRSGSADPTRLFIRDDESGCALPSYVDSQRGRVSATINRLRRYSLVAGEPGASMLMDKQYVLLGKNQPNPFNPATCIPFEIRSLQSVRLDVYSVSGRRIRTLVNEDLPPGFHRCEWDGRTEGGKEVPSGLYFYFLRTEAGSAAGRMLLVR